jgi:hypothetical protein
VIGRDDGEDVRAHRVPEHVKICRTLRCDI